MTGVLPGVRRSEARQSSGWLALLLGVLFVVAGCQDGTTPTAVGEADLPPAPGFSIQQLSQQDTPNPWELADAVPGFAGYFLSDGTPTVALTDPAQRPAAEQALAGWLTSRGFSASDLQVREADYDWNQLDSWHEAAWPAALSVSGAVSTEIDEGSNRLRFGGTSSLAVSAMRLAVTAAGVPRDAFVVERVAPVVLQNTLQDRIRPVVGGLQINFFPTPSAVTLLCTLGFNAIPEDPRFDPNPSFITNSHCSNAEGDGVLVRTEYYQPLRGGLEFDEENLIAIEADDPPASISADCPDLLPCRWSDASRAEYVEGVDFDFGKIARTAAFDPVEGTLELDPKKPTFQITGEQPFAVLGETVHKVGRTTGWTGGEVIATCQNILAVGATYVRRCQGRVAAGSAGGDSGSPVFTSQNRRGNVNSGRVILAGSLWAGSIDGPPEFIYSPMFNIERDLGPLTTH